MVAVALAVSWSYSSDVQEEKCRPLGFLCKSSALKKLLTIQLCREKPGYHRISAHPRVAINVSRFWCQMPMLKFQVGMELCRHASLTDRVEER